MARCGWQQRTQERLVVPALFSYLRWHQSHTGLVHTSKALQLSQLHHILLRLQECMQLAPAIQPISPTSWEAKPERKRALIQDTVLVSKSRNTICCERSRGGDEFNVEQCREGDDCGT